ncbi:MAG: hypothetical protein QM775_09555 [Pirellulales bacterium]
MLTPYTSACRRGRVLIMILGCATILTTALLTADSRYSFGEEPWIIDTRSPSHVNKAEAIKSLIASRGISIDVTSGVDVHALQNLPGYSNGETQLKCMLSDRPSMADHIQSKNLLWNVLSFMFSGAGNGSPIKWDGSYESGSVGKPPSFCKFTSSGPVIAVSANHNGRALSHDELWRLAVFELHNALLNSSTWANLLRQARDETISKRDFVISAAKMEYGAICATRTFYVQYFIPSIAATHGATDSSLWWCNILDSGDDYANSLVRHADASSYPWVPFESLYEFERAKEARREKNYAKAISIYDGIVRDGRSAGAIADSLRFAMDTSMQASSYTQGVSYGRRYLDIVPHPEQRAETRFYIAACFHHLNDLSETDAELIRAIQDDPHGRFHSRCLRYRIFIAAALADNQKTKSLCNEFLKRFPNDPFAEMVKGAASRVNEVSAEIVAESR